jgi:glycosyltransferase involved in cell wall biosynthesis
VYDVSVIMPIYNLKRYPTGWVERAISSVLEHQRGIRVQLCIGDDASTDGTQSILAGLVEKNSNIQVAYARRNTGGCDACNHAASTAEGKYFILLSCRSWYEPDSLARMAEYLDRNSKTGFVYGNTRFHGDVSRLKIAQEFSREVFCRTFASSFGYMFRRQAWDAGSRYDCKIWLPEEKRYMSIADRHMVMSLIFDRNYSGKHLDLLTLNYFVGGVGQMNDLFDKHRKLMMDEYRRIWGRVLQEA